MFLKVLLRLNNAAFSKSTIKRCVGHLFHHLFYFVNYAELKFRVEAGQRGALRKLHNLLIHPFLPTAGLPPGVIRCILKRFHSRVM